MIDIKQRQRQAWATGDYRTIGARLQIVSETLCEAVDLRGGQTVLDVATGTGNTAIAAARRSCDVTAIDYVPNLLEFGRTRAATEGFPVAILEGDAEEMRFPGQLIRCRTFDLRLDVRSEPPASSGRTGESVSRRRKNRRGKLDAFRIIGSLFPRGLAGGASTARCKVPDPMGHRSPFAAAFRRKCSPAGDPAAFRPPISITKRLGRGIPHDVGPLLKAFETLDTAGRERLVANCIMWLLNSTKPTTALLLPRPNIWKWWRQNLIAYNDVLSSHRASP